MLKRPLQCLCRTQLNIQIRIFKRDHWSLHIKTQYQIAKWVLKLSIPSRIISGSNWKNLEHIELQTDLPACFLNIRVYTGGNLVRSSWWFNFPEKSNFIHIHLCYINIQIVLNLAKFFTNSFPREHSKYHIF